MVIGTHLGQYEVTAAFTGTLVEPGDAKHRAELKAGDIFEVAERYANEDGNQVLAVCKPGITDYIELSAADVAKNCREISRQAFVQRDEQFGAASWNWDVYRHDGIEDDCAE